MVSVVFATATVFDFTGHLQVEKGETFILVLRHFSDRVKWFSDNDPVLSITESPDSHSAKIIAMQTGTSDIEITGRHGFIRTVRVKVVDNILEGFDVSQDDPEPKE